jgi:hypothetical protein
MNASQTLAFHRLLAAWNRREDARSAGDLAALGSARLDLEAQRANMRATLVAR